VSVRRHGGIDMGTMTIKEFIAIANKEIKENIEEFIV
jgi:hypothetical protein